jgi:hypothetical protein
MNTGTSGKYGMIGQDVKPVRKNYFLAQAALLVVGVVLFLSLSMAVFLSLSSKAYAF